MKTEKLSELNLNAVKRVLYGSDGMAHTVLENKDGNITKNDILKTMWKTNTLQDTVVAVKNNKHKVEITL